MRSSFIKLHFIQEYKVNQGVYTTRWKQCIVKDAEYPTKMCMENSVDRNLSFTLIQFYFIKEIKVLSNAK